MEAAVSLETRAVTFVKALEEFTAILEGNLTERVDDDRFVNLELAWEQAQLLTPETFDGKGQPFAVPLFRQYAQGASPEVQHIYRVFGTATCLGVLPMSALQTRFPAIYDKARILASHVEARLYALQGDTRTAYGSRARVAVKDIDRRARTAVPTEERSRFGDLCLRKAYVLESISDTF